MPLYDYHCESCKKSFEELRSFSEREGGVCRHCGQHKLTLKIVRFRIGKQGDLRESTEFHGCHPAEAEPQSHSHGPGCGHSHSHSPLSGESDT
jgi:putative FmdB family regulatory protein